MDNNRPFPFYLFPVLWNEAWIQNLHKKIIQIQIDPFSYEKLTTRSRFKIINECFQGPTPKETVLVEPTKPIAGVTEESTEPDKIILIITIIAGVTFLTIIVPCCVLFWIRKRH